MAARTSLRIPSSVAQATAPDFDTIDEAQLGAPPRRGLALCKGAKIAGTPYVIERWLGEGGMGAVLCAVHADIERQVAVKILHAHLCYDAKVVRNFRNEARASARIDTPHIVDILDLRALEDGRMLIAMEFLNGPTLSASIADSEMALPRFFAIARQICKAIGAAHGVGIVHCDIKPENVMLVRRDGRPDFVKVVDFGIAQFLADDPSPHGAGTPNYMAPEALVGTPAPGIDIYAIGCVMFEMLCGAPPFVATSPVAVITLHCDAPAPAPSSCTSRDDIAPELDAIILRCLSKDPGDRYASASELEADLLELQLAAGITTQWDDLPLPEVDRERATAMAQRLEALRHGRRGRRAFGIAGALLGVGLLTAAATWAWPEQVDQVEAVQARVNAARAAAAGFWWVYPDPDRPDTPTAYQEVLQLETLGSDDALSSGEQLRHEFSTTLVRLGDRYWDDEAARRFSFEYYAAAIVFEPSEHALERAQVSVVALDRLRTKAASGNFSASELVAVEPLAALAEPDDDARIQKLRALVARSPVTRTASVVDEILRSGAPRTGPASLGSGTAAPSPEVHDATEAAPEAAQHDASTPPRPRPRVQPKGVDDGEPPRRDRRLSDSLFREADRAHRRSANDEAVRLLNAALDADNRNVKALDLLGDILFDRARYSDALKVRKRAASLSPRSATRWLRAGDAYFKVMRYSDAKASYIKAKQLGNPKAAARIKHIESKMAGSAKSR